ncbi:MAG: sugar transferase [Bacteroidia bacterium]
MGVVFTTEEDRFVANALEMDIAAEQGIEKQIAFDSDSEIVDYISAHVDTDSPYTCVLKTRTAFNIRNLPQAYYQNIVNLKRINDISDINHFFETVNEKLSTGGRFICCAETYSLRKQRILDKFHTTYARLYYSCDFVFKRICPKLSFTRSLYFKMTAGRNQVISNTETLGRLYKNGFKIVDQRIIGYKKYYVVEKVKEPTFDKNASYGPIFKMKRIGKNGKPILVYKLRTMYAYSEYLQEYIYQMNNLDKGGKFKEDFRVSAAGKVLRKFWLDELPMVWNLLKGEMKLVGVRPLSSHYLSLYSPELQEERLKFKPGLIPPFYVDMPETLEEIQQSELRYLRAYQKNPILTDIKYFWKAIYNIVARQARSK